MAIGRTKIASDGTRHREGYTKTGARYNAYRFNKNAGAPEDVRSVTDAKNRKGTTIAQFKGKDSNRATRVTIPKGGKQLNSYGSTAKQRKTGWR